MKYFYLFVFLLISTFTLQAQDDYHNYLSDFLETDYNLTSGDWVFQNSESGIYFGATRYGGNFFTEDAQGQVFDKKIRCVINNVGNNPWDAAWKVGNLQTIQSGDKMLAVFYLRSVNGDGDVSFFVENNTTFSKEISLTFNITEDWKRYLIPFEVMSNYSTNSCGWGFHLGSQAQTIEIGGFTALNFKNTVEVSDLPSEINNQFYGGYEADAPWRTAAANRIEQIRKADFNIIVQNSNEDPVENGLVDIKMIRHNFDFGTTVVANRLANNSNYNIIYANKLTNLDGNGHGFNTVVFENDLKWDAWEEEWFVNKSQLQNAVTWLKEQDLEIRGHTLVWPGTSFLPEDIPANYGNIPYMRNRIMDHIEDIMTYPEIGTAINEWDVLNEVTINQNVANAFANDDAYETGRELYLEIFEKARAVNPSAELWLNDYVTMTLGNTAGNATYERLKQFTGELVNSSANIKGLGFQAHIGGAPNSIYEVLETLDDFYDSFGIRSKITEYDLPTFVDEELAGNYLRDFLTAIYSHESTDGFLFWSFWDGQTYMNKGSNLYRNDWTETKAHAAFVDLLFNEWWTEENYAADANGLISDRVFKGLYEVSYRCDGELVTETFPITEDTTIYIICDNLSTPIEDVSLPQIKIFPNPSNGILQINRSNNEEAIIRLFDTTGKTILEKNITDSEIILDIQDVKGLYFLEIKSDRANHIEKIVFE